MVRLESPHGEPASNDPRLPAYLANESEADEELRRIAASGRPVDGEIEYIVKGSNFGPVWKRRPQGK